MVLNATGYIVAADKIEAGRQGHRQGQWIGVEKGDHVKEGQVVVRLEDDEYQAQLKQAKGQLANLAGEPRPSCARIPTRGNRRRRWPI